jgi:hypothetical protein
MRRLSRSYILFSDMLFLIIIGLLPIIILILPFINPPEPTKVEAPVPGRIIVEMIWDPELPADIDLWVKAPGDIPVGYSNKGGRIFNLLRDDLGHYGDISKINYEIAYSRGRPSGEYIINVHAFSLKGSKTPIRVLIIISIAVSETSGTVKKLKRTVELLREGQEITVLRFILDENGRIDTKTVNDLYFPLR